MESVLSFCRWLEATGPSVAIRESIWTYPIIESIHVLGLTLFMGLLLLWDLRLVGVVLRRLPVTRVWRQLIPWIAIGAAVMTISGVLLFVSDPVRFYGNVFFRVKAVGLVVAVANATLFHVGVERSIAQWDTAPSTPRAARLAGTISIAVWSAVVISGRFVAYNWFEPLV